MVNSSVLVVPFTDKFLTTEYIEWLNDPEINKFLHIGRLPVIGVDLSERINNNNLFFAILFEDKFVGTISITRIDWINRKSEIGYIVGDKSAWGKGVASKAVKIITEYCFSRLNMHKVEAGVVDGNLSSIKVLEKNGFIKYAEIPEDYYLDNKYYKTYRFYKLGEK